MFLFRGAFFRLAKFTALMIMWLWPSALFLPPILASDTVTWRIVSVSITFLVAAALVWLSGSHKSRITDFIASREFRIITIAFIALALALLAAYLCLTSQGVVAGLGGDRGQALDIGISRIIHGQYPYSALTYDGGKITPLPGGFLLASPAYFLFGNSGYMALYLVPLSLWIMSRVSAKLWKIGAFSLLCAPVFWVDALSNGDLVITAFLAFAAAVGLLNAVEKGRNKEIFLLSICLGVSCSTRITTALISLVVFVLIASRYGNRSTLRVLTPFAGTFLFLSAPLYIADRQNFSPLHVKSFIHGQTGAILAISSLILILAFVLAISQTSKSTPLFNIKVMAFAISSLSILLTAIPLIIDPSDVTLYLSTYAVFAVTAPIAALRINPSIAG